MTDFYAPKPFRERLKETGRLAWLAVRLTWHASPCLTLSIILLLVLQALLSPLQLELSRLVLDSATFDLNLTTTPDALALRLPLPIWIALAAATLAASQLIQPFTSTFQSMVGDQLTSYVTEQLLRAANRWQGLERFEDPSFADDLQRARSHAARGGLELMVYGTQAVMELLSAASLALVLLGLQPLVPLVLILATLPQMAQYWEYRNRTGSHLYTQTAETRRLEYSRDVLLSPESAKDVRLYELGPFFRERYDAIFERTIATLDSLRCQMSVWVMLTSALAAAASGAVYLYIVWLVAWRQRTLGDLALYGGAATMLQMNLLDLSFEIGFLPMVFGFLPSLFRVLEAPPDLPLPDSPRLAPRPIRQGFVFEQVTFAYPGSAAPVLQSISFSLKPGECLALVGHNGAGKTTVIKLLLRLYDPTAGRILLDGIDLREYDLDDLRREMGVIFQDFVCYELSVSENIGLGQVEASFDRRRVLDAAAKAGASDLIHQLPDGLDTQLGREFGSRELSGGEWQKLALARAFMRECQLLVLDEPTAALDVQTEYDVYTRFHDLTRDRMTLLISHRFSTIRMADRILYLADGQIQEAGSHADLMTRNGEYAKLYQLQAAQYLDSDSTEVSQ